jgi:hypothetical protein
MYGLLIFACFFVLYFLVKGFRRRDGPAAGIKT